LKEPSVATVAPWIVTPESAVRLGAVAPEESCVIVCSVAEVMVSGNAMLRSRFSVSSLLTIRRLIAPSEALIA
jgi:hypothetical protein